MLTDEQFKAIASYIIEENLTDVVYNSVIVSNKDPNCYLVCITGTYSTWCGVRDNRNTFLMFTITDTTIEKTYEPTDFFVKENTCYLDEPKHTKDKSVTHLFEYIVGMSPCGLYEQRFCPVCGTFTRERNEEEDYEKDEFFKR